IQKLQEQQISELEELDELKEQVEAEQNRVWGLVNQTKNNISATEGEISAAEEAALAYEAELKAKEQDIAALQKQLAEELRLSQLSANSVWRDISEITFAEGDRYLLASLIYCEAGGEPYAGQVAVGAVVVNRVLSPVFPNTMAGVIYAPRQFSPVGSGRLEVIMASGKATASCFKAADEAMSGGTNVGNCVYFRTPVEGLSGINIGGHVFY
ncbi:MAG: cell wall hydrolase, partial [Lachnospiraceae bacterium]|nr:cell wall hydrolase [Lachnospiraceae bacterium]